MAECGANVTSPEAFTITQTCATFDFVVFSVFGGLIVVLGLAGNCVSFFVLWKDSAKTTTVFLLQCLAAADSAVLLAATPLYVIPHIAPHTGWLRRFHRDVYAHIVPACFMIYSAAYMWTISVTVLVTVNRYVYVCCPLWLKSSNWSRQKVQVILSMLALAALVYSTPRYFEYEVAQVCIDGNNTQTVFQTSSLGANRYYRTVYTNILYFMCAHGGPLLLLALLNSLLIRALRRREQRHVRLCRRASASAQQQEVTLVLVVVVGVFITCHTPGMVDHLLWTFVEQEKRFCGQWHYFYTAIADICGMLGSAINFIVYVLTSPRFRRHLTNPCSRSEHTAATIEMHPLTNTCRPVGPPPALRNATGNEAFLNGSHATQTTQCKRHESVTVDE